MFKRFKKFLGLEKRAVFYPGQAFAFRQGSNIIRANAEYLDHPIIQLAVRLFTDQLCSFEIQVLDKQNKRVDHPLLKVLKRPNQFQTGSQFLAMATKNILTGGQQTAVIKTDNTGMITELLPHVYAGQCWAYRKGNLELSDPETLAKGNFYYMANGRVYNKEDILSLKDLSFSNVDLLNGFPRLSALSDVLESGLSMTQTLKEINQSQIIQPDVFAAGEDFDPETKEAFIKESDDFWQQNTFSGRRRSMIYPPGFSRMQQTKDGSISSLLPDLKKISDHDIARAYGISFLINAAGSGQQSSTKELFRQWKNDTVKPWIQHIESQLSCGLLSELDQDRGFRLHFNQGLLTSLDRREVATFLKSMTESQILRINESRDLIGFPADPEGDCFKTETKKEDKEDKEDLKDPDKEDQNGPTK